MSEKKRESGEEWHTVSIGFGWTVVVILRQVVLVEQR